jgi:DNA-binding NtrC family response regulator
LSTTYGVIKQHNGYIWAYSELGKGTTFKVYLPSTEEEVKEIYKNSSAIKSGGTETILVVDDQPLIRQFVIDVLEPQGFKLYEAESAEDALKIMEKVNGKVDLLLTDLVMPGMKGNQLRELFNERWPNTKVIIMSGYGDKETVDANMKEVIFVSKPLTPTILTEKLRQVLDSELK